MKTFRLFLYCLAASICVSYAFIFSNKTIFHLKEVEVHDENPPDLILILFVAPLIETMIFQYIIYHILKYFKIKKDWAYIIIMSLVFSSFHFYSGFYMLMVFCSSIALNFFMLRHRKITSLLHYY